MSKRKTKPRRHVSELTPAERAQSEKAREVRLQKTYGITIKEYNKLLAVFDGCCWICRQPPKEDGVRLAIDHDHKAHAVKVKTRPSTLGSDWWAGAEYNGQTFATCWHKKADAVKEIKRQLKRASIRGLCCSWDNRGLQKFRDNAFRLHNAGSYLDDFKAGKTAAILER